jgi:hypothetical protein
MNFWKRVDSLLGEGQTIKWLCEELTLNYRSIINLRHANRLPSLDNGYKIANLLGTSVEFLLTGHDPYFEDDNDFHFFENDNRLEMYILQVIKKHKLL